MIIVGDIHGKIREFDTLCDKFPKEDLIIQLGDFGFGFFRGYELEFVKRFPDNMKFITGNHDDPALAQANPNYLGKYGYLSDHKAFYLGGAFSVDRDWRTPGISWWPDEELSQDELLKAIEEYIKCKPEIVLTHDCPSSVMEPFCELRSFKMECGTSRTAKALDHMFNAHQPKAWYFGHHHISKTIEVKGTVFRCLNELEWCKAYEEIKLK